MSKKIIVVAESLVQTVKDSLDKHNGWEDYEMVVVRDEDFDNACGALDSTLPEGKIRKDVLVEDFIRDGH